MVPNPYSRYIIFKPHLSLPLSSSSSTHFCVCVCVHPHFLLLFKHNCLHFLPHYPPPLQPSPLPILNPTLLWLCPCVLYTCSLMTIHPFPPLAPHPLWLLSVCSLFQCLWLYFACFYVLLIRFQLKVRSYGTCLSLPGLFHTA